RGLERPGRARGRAGAPGGGFARIRPRARDRAQVPRGAVESGHRPRDAGGNALGVGGLRGFLARGGGRPGPGAAARPPPAACPPALGLENAFLATGREVSRRNPTISIRTPRTTRRRRSIAMRKLWRISSGAAALGLAALLLLPRPAAGQATGASLAGRVTDEQG